MENFPRLQAFFDNVRNYGFWQRLFSWPELLKQIAGAWAELIEFSGHAARLKEERDKLAGDLRVEYEKSTNLSNRANELKTELATAEEKLRSQKQLHLTAENTLASSVLNLQTENRALMLKVTELTTAEEQRKNEAYKEVQRAFEMQRILAEERSALQENEHQKVRDHHEKLKRSWSEHQEKVKKKIEIICGENTLKYVTEVPFKGSPDNVVQIGEELVIFDAKSPSSPEELGNFRNYIKRQCEEAGKYARHETVRKEIYFVIPSEAAEVIDFPTHETEGYKVYIITPDAIEPVLLTLRKIEAYELLQEIGPEERQAIVRVIGQLVYAAKRRIQVDQFFNGTVLDMLRKVLTDIPETLQQEIVQVELAAKLNPGMDKRSKGIALKELEEMQRHQHAMAEALETSVPEQVEAN